MVESPLGNDSPVGNNNHRPVELLFEVGDYLLTDLLERNMRSEGDLEEQYLALGSVLLSIFH